MAAENLTAERVRDLLDYNQNTGVFTWRGTGKWKAAGEVAGYTNALGYVYINIDQRLYLAHRLAWLYVYGVWPSRLVDHKDRVSSHNWIENLRDVPDALNLQNQGRAHTNSRTGVLGVYRRYNRYTACLNIAGQNVFRKTFSTVEEAQQAYLDAKRRFHEGFHHDHVVETKLPDPS